MRRRGFIGFVWKDVAAIRLAIAVIFFEAALFSPTLAAQTEAMSDLLDGEGLAAEDLMQAPQEELFSEGLEESAAIEGLLSQEELDAIKNGGAKVPPVENEGLEPRILPTGESKSAVTPQALSLPSGEASIGGMGESFQPLLSTGAASMSVPIMLPPGRAGLQPSLSFSYLSSRGSGILGIGWDIPVPFISRQTDKGMPRYDRNSLDRFIYNGGEELVPVAAPADTSDCEVEVWYDVPYYAGESGGWVADPIVRNVEVLPEQVCGWWYFRTKLEGTFMRFFMNPAQSRWIVQDKGGTLYYFGETASSRIEFEGGAKIFQWNLTRVVDVHGNVTMYEYEKSQGQSYLRHVWWNVRLLGDGAPWTDCSPARDCYGHHVELVYDRAREDVLTSYASGFPVTTGWRLIRVTVESVDLDSGLWRHTRDYDLAYDGSSYYSMLESIQLWGRDRADSLPAMMFGYTQVEAKRMDGGSGLEIPGFGGFDERIWDFAFSPPHSVDDARADLFDANSDGFADLLVTDPARYADGHGLFVAFCDGSWNCSYRQADEPLYLHGAFSVGTDFTLSNTNVNPMDIDSDGVVEFLHMPHLRDYGYYRIEKTTPVQDLYSGYQWASEGPFDPEYVDPDIDFTRDAAEIQLVDLDNDHMVDVVKTAGTRMEHWLNLGRCEGGEGKFGTPRYDAYGKCTGFTKEPITSCVLYRGLPKKFSDGDLRLADMNGDGMQDIVHLRQGDVAWWAGRGPGVWGDGGACPAGTYGDDRETVMDGSYWEMNPEIHEVFLSDVNADGLSDILQVRFDAVDVWLNTSGTGFLSRYVISRTPAHPGFTNRVRFADVDGTGTPDILWGDAGNYRYMDLMGRTKPRVLNRIENGLGKVTTVEYVPSSKFYVEDVENGRPVSSVTPFPSFVVFRVTVSDSLGWEQATEYAYHDGYYDGCEGEFRGFREVVVKSIGDRNSPTSFERTVFHLGERQNHDCLADNPLEGLKGQIRYTEHFDEAGVYLETDWNSYRVENLFSGLDGRGIRYAYADSAGRTLYDTSQFLPAAEGASLAKPGYRIIDGGVETSTAEQDVPVRGTQYAEILDETLMDVFGNPVIKRGHGRLGMEGDETVTHARSAVIGTWSNRMIETWVEGSTEEGEAHERLFWTANFYDSRGSLVETRTKHHIQLPSGYPEPLMTSLSGPRGWELDPGDGVYRLLAQAYTPAGLARETSEGGSQGDGWTPKRHREVEYDPVFGSLPVAEHITATAGLTLSSLASWDSGFNVVITMEDFNSQATIVNYDPLGRLLRLYKPGCLEPSETYSYTASRPVSVVEQVRNETCLEPGDPAAGPRRPDIIEDDGTAGGIVSYSFLDGLERIRGKVTEGDPRLDTPEPAPWVVSDHVLYDTKGGVFGRYVSYSLTDPMDFNPAGASGYIPVVRIENDAFGRQIRNYAADGTIVEAVSFGLLREDAWDAEDLGPGGDFGTQRTLLYDGREKVVRVVERLRKIDGTLSLLAVSYQYDTTGNMRVVERGRLAGGEYGAFEGPVVRKEIVYDSLGRRVFQDDPDGGVYYYVMNELGEIVRTQDARGIVNAYGYDMAARLVTEDYGADGLIDVTYGYDVEFMSASPGDSWYTDAATTCHRWKAEVPCPGAQGPLLGRLSWVEDRSGHRISGYDVRGRAIWADRQVSKFDLSEGGIGGIRTDDYSQFWHVTREYDELDRIVMESFPEEGAALFYEYSPRGLLDAVWLKRPSEPIIPLLADFNTFSAGTGLEKTGKTKPDLKKMSPMIYRGDQEKNPGLVRSIVGKMLDIFSIFGGGRAIPSYEVIPEDAVPVVARVHYDAEGRKVQVEYGDGSSTVTEYHYDLRKRLVNLFTYQQTYFDEESGEVTPRTLMNYVYGYDLVKNIVSIVDQRDLDDMAQWGLSPAPVPVNYRFHYDSLGRLVHAQPVYHAPQPGRVGAQEWEFNDFGSMREWVENSSDSSSSATKWMASGIDLDETGQIYHPDALYKMARFDSAAGAYDCWSFDYDEMGNMLGYTQYSGCLDYDPSTYECGRCTKFMKYEFLWDENGMLATGKKYRGREEGGEIIFDDLTDEIRNTFDSGNSRVVRETLHDDDEKYTMFISGMYQLRDADIDSGAWVGKPIGWISKVDQFGMKVDFSSVLPGQTSLVLVLFNHIFNAELFVDLESGKILEMAVKKAYGDDDVTCENPLVSYDPEYSFNNKEKEESFDIFDYGTRFYSPVFARWLSADAKYYHGVDPLTTSIGKFNLYEFSLSNPIVYIDLIGEDLYVTSDMKDKIVKYISDACGKYVNIEVSDEVTHVFQETKQGNKYVAVTTLVHRVTLSEKSGVISKEAATSPYGKQSETLAKYLIEVSQKGGGGGIDYVVSGPKHLTPKQQSMPYPSEQSYPGPKSSFISLPDVAGWGNYASNYGLDPNDPRVYGFALGHEIKEAQAFFAKGKAKLLNILPDVPPSFIPSNIPLISPSPHDWAVGFENIMREEMGFPLNPGIHPEVEEEIFYEKLFMKQLFPK